MDLSSIDFSVLLINITVLLFSLSIHEAAHAWTADRLGDSTGRDLGRVSLNPIVHIDLLGTIIFPIIAFLSGWFFGWAKPVPVNPGRFGNPRRDHMLVAAAGPASNIVAAIGFLVGVKLIRGLFPSQVATQDAVIYPVFMLFLGGLMINTILAIFNLIPIPPLDGSWILSSLLPESLAGLLHAMRPYGFMLLMVLAVGGVFGAILRPVMLMVWSLAR